MSRLLHMFVALVHIQQSPKKCSKHVFLACGLSSTIAFPTWIVFFLLRRVVYAFYDISTRKAAERTIQAMDGYVQGLHRINALSKVDGAPVVTCPRSSGGRLLSHGIKLVFAVRAKLYDPALVHCDMRKNSWP